MLRWNEIKGSIHVGISTQICVCILQLCVLVHYWVFGVKVIFDLEILRELLTTSDGARFRNIHELFWLHHLLLYLCLCIFIIEIVGIKVILGVPTTVPRCFQCGVMLIIEIVGILVLANITLGVPTIMYSCAYWV